MGGGASVSGGDPKSSGLFPFCGYACGKGATPVPTMPADPNRRLFGTHWCGRGGGGVPINSTDVACMHHDACFANIGLDADLYNTGILTRAQREGSRRCNQTLCNTVTSLNEANKVTLGFRVANAAIRGYFTFNPLLPYNTACSLI